MSRSKDLFELVKPYPNVRIASESEGAALAEFSKSQYMKVKDFGVGFDRGADFFDLFRAYTKQFWVFLVLNDDGSVGGTGSVTRFTAIVDSLPKSIGYLSDLRMDPTMSPSARLQWRDVYEAIVLHLEDKQSPEYCDYVLTAVFQENEKALHILKNRMPKLAFHQIRPYWTLSIFSSFLSSRPSRAFAASSSKVAELEKMERPSLAFARLPVGEAFQPMIISGKDGRPVMGTIVYDARKTRQLRVFNLPWKLKLGFKILSLFTRKPYSETLPWTIKSLSCISWAASVSPDVKLQAIGFALRACLDDSESTSHMVNVTVMDEAKCRELQRKFPVSKSSSGWLCQITGATGKPTLTHDDVIFDGGFF